MRHLRIKSAPTELCPFGMKSQVVGVVTLMTVLAAGSVVSAATLFPNHTVGAIDVLATLQQASRWSSASGLSDGIQVAVAPGFAEALGAANAAEVAQVEGAVLSVLGTWANPGLQFGVTFDGAAVEGTGAGFEIDLFAVPSSHPAFSTNSFFGVAFVDDQFILNRPLTNGQAFDGYAITGADVYVCIDRLLGFSQTFGLTQAQELAALQRLLMHEFGHGIGLDHPNTNTLRNFDNDNDPLNVLTIDPLNPFAGVIASPFVDANAIMSNNAQFSSLFQTFLSNDDLAGRDLLYPVVPEPSTLSLAGLGVVVLAAGSCRRRSRA